MVIRFCFVTTVNGCKIKSNTKHFEFIYMFEFEYCNQIEAILFITAIVTSVSLHAFSQINTKFKL